MKKEIYYRSVKDAAPIIYPEYFPGSEDSTVPPGKYSFWFYSPIDFKLSGIVAVARLSPTKAGIMSYSEDGIWFESQIPEFVSSIPIKVDSWIVEEHIYTFAEDYQGFCICEENILYDGKFVARVSEWNKEDILDMEMPYILSKHKKNVQIVKSIDNIQAHSEIKSIKEVYNEKFEKKTGS